MVYVANKNILVLLHGYKTTIINPLGDTEVDAAFYSTSIYKIYDNVPIKILSNQLINSFTGVDGFYNNQYHHYPYKTHVSLLKKANEISLNDKEILISLESALKQNINNSYNETMDFWNTDVLRVLISNIPITKSNVEHYNNIAFYFGKIGKYSESIFILNQIITLFPNRIVAYINLGDSFWDINKKENAIQNYQIIY